jgi:N6-adenosine-specific RNA methylase IME4
MKVEDICALPVKEICDENCWLFLWATWQNLLDAIQVIPAWGFTYKGCAFVWVKEYRGTLHPYTGLGQNTRQGTEVCLLGKRGAVHRQDNSVPQIIHNPVIKHSEKPNKARQYILRLCGDLPRVELFARQKTLGWDVWGNEVKSDITLGDMKDTTAWARRA